MPQGKTARKKTQKKNWDKFRNTEKAKSEWYFWLNKLKWKIRMQIMININN